MRFFLFFVLFISCDSNGEYLSSDFRIFKYTKSWILAKYVDDNNIDGIESEIAKDSTLLSFQESKYGQSLLHLAIYNKKYEAFNKLLELGFKTDLYNYYAGETPFLLACGGVDEEDSYKYFDRLVKHGDDINQIMKESNKMSSFLNYSGLMYASYAENVKIVKRLLELGVDYNYLNSDNRNALSVAVNNRYFEIASMLLKNGSDCSVAIYHAYNPDGSLSGVYICDFLKTDEFIRRDKKDFLDFVNLVKEKKCCQ